MKANAGQRMCFIYMQKEPKVFCAYTTKHADEKKLPEFLGEMVSPEIRQRFFVHPHQVHQDRICVVDESVMPEEFDVPSGETCDYDGLVTNRRDVVLTTVHADCLAVYLYDPVHQAIGLCHAGWRGSAKGIAVKMLNKMKETYGTSEKEVLGAISAGISQCCFQVGEEVVEEFRKTFFFTDEYVTCDAEGTSNCTVCADMVNALLKKTKNDEPEPVRYHMNLKGINKRQLMEAGVPSNNIETDFHCTCCEPNLFWSYRREGTKNRQTAILLLR